MFDNRKTNSNGLLQLLNMFYEELFGDRVQLSSLCNCCLRAQSSHTTTLLKKNNSSTAPVCHPEIQLPNNALKETIYLIEEAFDKAIKSCFTDFTAISEPILSVQEMNTLANTYKTKLPSHYNMMKITLGIDKKISLTKNHHLVTSGYYDCKVMYLRRR